MFAQAGWCNECGADDLMFAIDLSSRRVFLFCTACATAGRKTDDDHLHIEQVHGVLAPGGWTLATRIEVEAAGLEGFITGETSASDTDLIVDLIESFPGFKRRSD